MVEKAGTTITRFLLENATREPEKMVKPTQAIRQLVPTNCLSVFDHYSGRRY